MAALRKNLVALVLVSMIILTIAPLGFAARKAPAKLSFSAKPRMVKVGKALLFKGRLINKSGRALRGKIVVLQRKDVKRVVKKIKGKKVKVKKAYWRSLKRKRTNRRGFYVFKLKPKKSATYRVRSKFRRRVPAPKKSPSPSAPAPAPASEVITQPVVSSPVTVVVTRGAMADRLGFSCGNHLVWLNDQELASQLDSMAAIGVKWIRHDMDWNVIQPNSSIDYSWSRYDRLVTEVNKRNMKLLPILAYTPSWARRADASSSMFSAPANPDQFASFAKTTAAHYAAMGIHNWEIWNEPNITNFWKPAPNVSDYTVLLKKAYVSIKQADNSATIVSAGLSPATTSYGNIAPLDFVSSMYANGAKGYFDVLGHHPYCFPELPSSYFSWSAWSQMSDTSRSIRSIMASYGDSGKNIWGTEFGAPTSARSDVSESLQARTIEAAALQMQSKPWLEKLFIYSYKDIGTSTSTIENFFGVLRYNGSAKPAYYSVKSILSQ